jgi:MOSC domain-containing protein YiiM
MDQVAASRYDPALAAIQAAPADHGRLQLIVRRPAENEREIVEEALLDRENGLVGDRWAQRHAGNPVYLDAQLTIISTRLLAAIEPDRDRWPIVGDQLYVDFDLREETLPAGSRVAIGSAVIEISEAPHTGCAKFSARFGSDALRWINSSIGRAHRLRGLNARVVQTGTVRIGDAIRRL